MKANIDKIGTFTEDSKGNKTISGWTLKGYADSEAYSLEELKQIAIDNDTYTLISE